MASGYTDTAIANLALGVLCQRTIADFDQEKNNDALWFKTNYAHIRNELLSAYPWNFARGRALLPMLVEKPAFGWKYAYELPSDLLSPLPLTEHADEDGVSPAMEIEGNQLLCDVDGPLRFRYVRRMEDPAKFSQNFVNCLVPFLASRAAHKITGKRSYAETALREYGLAFERYTALDDLQNAAEEIIR